MLKTYWPTVISNQQLWQMTQKEPIELEIKRRKWKWLGHTLRGPQTDINRAALEWDAQGSRRRGRPINTWRRTVVNEAKSNGLTSKQVKTVAQNRVRWKCVVNAICSWGSYRTYILPVSWIVLLTANAALLVLLSEKCVNSLKTEVRMQVLLIIYIYIYIVYRFSLSCISIVTLHVL
jgi:hypothetical protein